MNNDFLETWPEFMKFLLCAWNWAGGTDIKNVKQNHSWAENLSNYDQQNVNYQAVKLELHPATS